MIKDLATKAVQSALACNWESAIETNLAILAHNSNDIQALNRLAKAYMELGQKDDAKHIYQKVLELDKYNAVALKNLQRLPQKQQTADRIADEDFLEEPGRTKSVKLIKIADRQILAELYTKQPVNITPKVRLVSVLTTKGKYIGSLPDDLSVKISKLLKIGCEYTACLKSVSDKEIVVFLREIKRSKRLKGMASFYQKI